MRILIVDDEMEVLTLFKDVLESAGHTVEIAIDGEKGIKKFKNGHEFDLVIMDYRMHGEDGVEVSKKLWKIDENARILFVSADPTIQEETLEMGVVGFLLKPFDVEELVETVRELSPEATVSR